VKTPGAAFAIHGEAKDISQGGVYIELSAPLPVNSKVNLDLGVEETRFEATGVVRTSYPLLGMGICFQNLTPENTEKLFIVLGRAQRRSAREGTMTSAQHNGEASKSTLLDSAPGENRKAALLQACRVLTGNFDDWKRAFQPDELEELKFMVHELDQKLSPAVERFVEYSANPVQSSKAN
jgi:hypothetical protein